MNGIDSYLVLSTDREAYALGSVTTIGWYRLDDDGRPVGQPLGYRDIERRWVSLDYSRNWEEAKKSLDERRRSIARREPRRRRTTGTLIIRYVPTITVSTFADIVSTVEDKTGIAFGKMAFGPKSLVVHDVCAEDYETTGFALADLISPELITDISWTGGETE